MLFALNFLFSFLFQFNSALHRSVIHNIPLRNGILRRKYQCVKKPFTTRLLTPLSRINNFLFRTNLDFPAVITNDVSRSQNNLEEFPSSSSLAWHEKIDAIDDVVPPMSFKLNHVPRHQVKDIVVIDMTCRVAELNDISKKF